MFFSKKSIIVLLVLGFASCHTLSSSTEKNEKSDLVFVSVLFRHGDRTPSHFPPNDPYKHKSYWPDGFGQLTNAGKQQGYQLGKWLRSRYDLLLTEEYSPNILYVESTDWDRTIMSAQCVLAGMYPPKGRQKWKSNLEWQPIPVHTTPLKHDQKFSRPLCPNYKKEYKNVLESQEIKELNNKFSDVFSVLNNNSGEIVSNLVDIELIFSTLLIEHRKNLTLPEWTKGFFPQRLEEAAIQSLGLHTWTPKLARLKIGFLLKDMIQHMKQKCKETEKDYVPKMWVYSAHDITIISLLNSLKVSDLHFPPYTSAVLVELREDTEGNHFVMLFYRNSTIHEPYLLTVPGCASMCPLDKFLELSITIIPEDWNKECL